MKYSDTRPDDVMTSADGPPIRITVDVEAARRDLAATTAVLDRMRDEARAVLDEPRDLRAVQYVGACLLVCGALAVVSPRLATVLFLWATHPIWPPFCGLIPEYLPTGRALRIMRCRETVAACVPRTATCGRMDCPCLVCQLWEPRAVVDQILADMANMAETPPVDEAETARALDASLARYDMLSYDLLTGVPATTDPTTPPEAA